jgi:hypothetical protein
MSQVIVVEPHVATYAQAIHATAGETVTVGPEDIDFPGWVWCISTSGVSSWVPKAFLEIEGESGKLLREYHAGELTVAVGERLSVVEEESGWYLCETESNQRGWVPIENVRPI